MAVENLQRKDLTIVEEGETFNHLKSAYGVGTSNRKIAGLLGVSPQRVDFAINAYTKLSSEVQQMVQQKQITEESTRALTKLSKEPEAEIGFHRITAAIIACIPEITCDIKEGTKRDAILYSVGANASHGLRRTNADKRKAVEILLKDDEWKLWSDREIARRCCVDNSFVSRLRKEKLSVVNPQIEPQERLVERNGTIYSQNTSNIGRSPYAKPIDITKESKAPPVVPEPTVYHWEQPESKPVDPEVITFEDEE